MALDVKQVLRTHGAFVSAVTATSVGVAVIALQLAEFFVSWSSAGFPGQAIGPTFGYAALEAIPFAAGFFLSLWLVAPIAEELRVGHVITRAVLATGIGATVMFVVFAIVAVISSFQPDGALFGNSLSPDVFDGSSASWGLLNALSTTVRTFVQLLPLGVLAGVLLWVWRKDHPPRHPLAGIIDV